jgi:hypothetical protein
MLTSKIRGFSEASIGDPVPIGGPCSLTNYTGQGIRRPEFADECSCPHASGDIPEALRDIPGINLGISDKARGLALGFITRCWDSLGDIPAQITRCGDQAFLTSF